MQKNKKEAMPLANVFTPLPIAAHQKMDCTNIIHDAVLFFKQLVEPEKTHNKQEGSDAVGKFICTTSRSRPLQDERINIIHRAPSPCKQSRNKDKNAK